MPHEPISLMMPASREALAVLRTVAGSVAHLQSFPLNRVEDTRLAVSEAAAIMIGEGTGGSLRCVLSLGASELVAEISGGPITGPWPPPHWEGSFEQIILTTVADSVEIVGEGETSSIRARLSG